MFSIDPLEALPSNAKGARLLTGEIFKVTSIKEEVMKNETGKKKVHNWYGYVCEILLINYSFLYLREKKSKI